MGDFSDALERAVSESDVSEIQGFDSLDDMDNFAEEFAKLINKFAREASTDHVDSDFGVSVDGAVQEIANIIAPSDGERYFVQNINSTVVYIESVDKFEIEGIASVPNSSHLPNPDAFTAGSKIKTRSNNKELEVEP